MEVSGVHTQRLTFDKGDSINPSWSVSPDVLYVPPVIRTPTPDLQSLTQPLQNEPLVNRTKALASGDLVYAFNDLKTAPYPSFVGAHTNGQTRNYRLQGPNLQGTEGDFVFDPQLLPSSNNVLLKLGDPAVRERNPYNSYRLWNWNRTTNALTAAAPRELFFRHVAPAPDGNRIAYIAGGNALGQTPAENGGIGEPLRLYIYDAQSKTETLVSDNEGVRGGFNWLDANTLLYTELGKPEKTELNPKGWARPSIYAFDVKSGKSTLLLNEARHPMPSPDGSRIAFWGLRAGEMLPLPDDWWQNTGYAHLSVAKRDGSERKAYSRLIGPYPSLVWAPDNQRMFTVEQRPASDKDTARPITEWNLRLGQARRVGTLQTKDVQKTERAWFQPQFRALGVAPDGKSLVVAVEEVSATGQVTQRVQSVELATGKSTEVAKLRDVAGFDWRAAPLQQR